MENKSTVSANSLAGVIIVDKIRASALGALVCGPERSFVFFAHVSLLDGVPWRQTRHNWWFFIVSESETVHLARRVYLQQMS